VLGNKLFLLALDRDSMFSGNFREMEKDKTVEYLIEKILPDQIKD
jgi:hypothetical protein